MHIVSLHVENFRALQDVKVTEMTGLNVVIGANGSGKSTLFDVFAFLRDALSQDMVAAVEARGGWASVCTQGREQENIRLTLQYRVNQREYLVLAEYQLELAFEKRKFRVASERLRLWEKENERWSKPYLEVADGQGFAYDDGLFFGITDLGNTTRVELESPTILALKPLGQYVQFRALVALRKLLNDYIVFEPSTMRMLGPTAVDTTTQLQPGGQNVTRIAKHFHDEHPEVFATVVQRMARRIPGLESIKVQETIDGRIVLGFKDASFRDPFQPKYISDGTLKLFAYLLLVNHPTPRSLIAIEEPENYIHPDLHQILAEELRAYGKRGGQVLVSTHSREFVNGLRPEELFWLTKAEGKVQVKCAANDELVRAFYESGDQLGYLWRTNHFTGNSPIKPVAG
jgi:predicted ATPase